MARAGTVTVKLTKNRLPEIAQQLPVARRVILARRGDEMRAGAARRSRVDTGDMRDGWEWRETNEGGYLTNEVPHTVFNEYGTRHMSAQPMARPAFDEVAPKIVDDFENLERFLS